MWPCSGILSPRTLQGANSRGRRGYVCNIDFEFIDLEVVSALEVVCHRGGYRGGGDGFAETIAMGSNQALCYTACDPGQFFGHMFVERLTSASIDNRARRPSHLLIFLGWSDGPLPSQSTIQ